MVEKAIGERRSNVAQRAAVVTVLSRATGPTSILRADDGSVFVYEEHREWTPPTTVRRRVTPDGLVGPPVKLVYD